MKRTWLLGAGLLLLMTSTAFAQDNTITPKTKVEIFQLNSGSVIVKGYTVIGRLNVPASAPGKAGGEITVTCWSLHDPLRGPGVRAISVDMEDEAKHQSRAYIDADEIDALLQGIDYVSRIDKTITKLANFEALFQTKGDFSLSAFNEPNGSLSVAFKIGAVDPLTASLPYEALNRFGKLVTDAKATLASLD